MGFIAPMRGRYGRAEFFTVLGARVPGSWHEQPETSTEPEKFCEGVYIFPGGYHWLEDDSGRFLYKPEFRHVANELVPFGGSSGGNVFNNIVKFLARYHEKNFRDIYSKLSHEQKSHTVGLEQTVVEEIATGIYRGRSTERMLSKFGRDVIQAVLAGVDRSGYPDESFDPNNHLTAQHLGYAVIEHILGRFPELDPTELTGKRLGDLLALAGVDLKDFKPEHLFAEHTDLQAE